MKIQDLRIGNWVLKGTEICEVKGIDKFRIEILRPNYHSYTCYADIEHLKPIALTEEILLKCGFELKGVMFRIKNGSSRQFDVNYSPSRDIYYYDSSKYGIYTEVEIKYLHQLQNMYYSLTNKELNYERFR